MMHAHNPIMQRLEEMAAIWQQQTTSHHALIRWMLKPEESRMYEGFCRLEASPHGQLDNLFIFFYTPFVSQENFSHAIMENWLKEYDENIEQRALLAAAGVKGDWDLDPFRDGVTKNEFEKCDALLLQMLLSYRQWLKREDTDLVLALLPRTMSSPGIFNTWLFNFMRQDIPSGIHLLLFDHAGGNFFGKAFEKLADRGCTLTHELRMQEAIEQIATSGASDDPHAFYRQCLFEMGKAANKKNKLQLCQWGDRAVESAKKSGDRSLLATTYLSYAGLLFNFKDHEKITVLLEKGMRLSQEEVLSGKENMKPLLLQFYAFTGAHHQLKKERTEALKWFMKMGDQAKAYLFYPQAVSAYYKAFIFAEYKNRTQEKDQAVHRAMQLTSLLSPEEIQSSEYPFMAYDFLLEAGHSTEGELTGQVRQTIEENFGPDWQQIIEELKENYTKKRLREAKAAADAREAEIEIK